MRPFDLEAAKRGEGVELVQSDGTKTCCHFIGVDSSQSIVIDSPYTGLPILINPERLCMAPKNVTVRYRVCAWKAIYETEITTLSTSESNSVHIENSVMFRGWLDDWKTAEVPQGGE
jgi:hypothetical protein